jgi:hypothetical protein
MTQGDEDHLLQLIMRKTETHERFQIGQQPRMGPFNAIRVQIIAIFLSRLILLVSLMM